MKMKFFRKLALLFFLLALSHPAEAVLTPFPGGFSITNMVKRSDLVFTGEVVELQFVFREDVPPQFTTDVTVKVEEMIKGQPNTGENLVKFMIEGGKGLHPKTGEHLICKVGDVPPFKKGEKILLFLAKTKVPELQNRPYGRLILLWGFFGKQKIIDGEISFPYMVKKMVFIDGKMAEKEVLLPIKLPAGLVVQIAKASLKKEKATEALDERIKALVAQTPHGQQPKPDEAFLGNLRAEVKKLLEKE